MNNNEQINDELLKEAMFDSSMKAVSEFVHSGGNSDEMDDYSVIDASSAFGEFMQKKSLARKIRMRLSEMDNHHDDRTFKRLDLAIDLYLNLVGAQSDKYVAKVKGGLQLGNPELEPMSEADAMVVKATRNELEVIAKNYAKKSAEYGKQQDASGYYIRDYQNAELDMFMSFVESLPDQEIYVDDIQRLIALQHELNLVISTNNGKATTKDVDQMVF